MSADAHAFELVVDAFMIESSLGLEGIRITHLEQIEVGVDDAFLLLRG